MEIRAHYIRIGVFTLAVIAAGFVFVYWLHNTGGLRERTVYQVRFESTVSGLLTGSAVLFNGIRVGEVTALELSPQDPRQVTVTIAVDRATPVRGDTRVEIDFQGLAGAPVIALKGGSATSPALAAARGQPPLLTADSAASQSMTQAARDVLRRFDTILADNAEPLRSTIANLDTFSGALARNSDRLDGIVAGLERLTGGAAKGTATVYDLSAPRTFPLLEKSLRGQLVVPEPNAAIALDTQKILVRAAAADSPSFGNAQWSDAVPKLIQAKVIQSFENAGYLGGVSRPMEGLTAEFQLLIDIRRFQFAVAPEPVADIEFAAKILGENGRIVSARVFHATAPAKAAAAPAAVAALDEAFGKAATELVLWTSGALASPSPPRRPSP